jgi:hypothetical protein
MGLGLPEKVAAFCRELSDDSLLSLAQENGMEEAYARAYRSLQHGLIGAALEADLDAIDEMARRVEGEGLYPAATRTIPGWPGAGASTGAQWWTCPVQRCAGRGRVMPGQQPPVCAATGQALEPRPVQE